MVRLRIGIDLDGVIFKFMESFDKFMGGFGYKVLKDTFYLSERYGLHNGDEPEFLRIFGEQRKYRELEVINGAKEGIAALAKQNDIFILTARLSNRETKQDTLLSLYENGILPEGAIKRMSNGWNSNAVLFSSAKHLIVLQKGIDLLIDDDPRNCMPLHESQTAKKQKCETYLFDQSYNRDFEHKDLPRGRWPEIVKKINGNKGRGSF